MLAPEVLEEAKLIEVSLGLVRGTPGVLASSVDVGVPCCTSDEGVPAPVDIPAVCGSWVVFCVPLAVVADKFELAIEFSIASHNA